MATALQILERILDKPENKSYQKRIRKFISKNVDEILYKLKLYVKEDRSFYTNTLILYRNKMLEFVEKIENDEIKRFLSNVIKAKYRAALNQSKNVPEASESGWPVKSS